MSENKKQITLTCDPILWRVARQAATRDGVVISRLLERALTAWLRNRNQCPDWLLTGTKQKENNNNGNTISETV